MFIRYFERDLSVIPTIGKRPIEKEWSRWCTERQPEELIEKYERERKLPAYGIGLCLGPASGIVALDVDSDSRDILDFVANTLPLSPVRKRGSKGYTAFYRPGAGMRSCNAFRTNQGENGKASEGIEILWTGRQTVLPPSYNPDAERNYTWLTNDTLEDVTLDSLPVLEMRDVERVFTFIRSFGNSNSKRNTTDVFTGGRNNRLTVVACAMLCSEPWESDEILAQKLLDVDSLEHEKPYFSDADEPEYKNANGSAFGAALIFIRRHRAQLNKKGVLSETKPMQIDIKQVMSSAKSTETPRFPESKGLIGEIKNAIMRINRSGGQDELATGAAIAICSTLASNRFHIDARPVNTHQFMLCVARSGKGKGAAVKIAEGLFFHEKLKSMNLRGLSNYSSIAAFVEHLPAQRTRLDIIDEFGSVLKGFSSQSDLKKELEGLLCSIYSNGAGYFVGHNTKGQNRQGACYSPSVSIFANVQEDTLVKFATASMLQSGFLSRFLYFSAKENTQFNPNYLDAIDLTPIAEECSRIFPYNGMEVVGTDGSITTDIGQIEPTRAALFYAEGVKEYRKGLDRWFYEKERETLARGDLITSTFLTRQFEMADKIAVTNAICMDRREITKNDFDYACEVIKACMARAGSFLKEMASETPFDKSKQKVFNLIEKNTPISRKELLFKSKIKVRIFDEIIRDLIETQCIGIVNIDSKQHYGIVHK
jgi:hypothetical protein